jgi:hypothetical protein
LLQLLLVGGPCWSLWLLLLLPWGRAPWSRVLLLLLLLLGGCPWSSLLLLLLLVVVGRRPRDSLLRLLLLLLRQLPELLNPPLKARRLANDQCFWSWAGCLPDH